MMRTRFTRCVLVVAMLCVGQVSARADFKVGDIVQLQPAGVTDWAVEKCFISRVVKSYRETWGEEKCVVEHLQLPSNMANAGSRRTGAFPADMRLYRGAYINDYDPSRYYGTWRLSNETSVTPSTITIQEGGRFSWRPEREAAVTGQWIKSERPDDPDAVMILKNGWRGRDWTVYPASKHDGHLDILVRDPFGISYGGPRVGAEPKPTIVTVNPAPNNTQPVPAPLPASGTSVVKLPANTQAEIRKLEELHTKIGTLAAEVRQTDSTLARQIEVLKTLQADPGADQASVQNLLTYLERRREKIKQTLANSVQRDEELQRSIEALKNQPAQPPVAPTPPAPTPVIPVQPPAPAPPVPAKQFQIGEAVEVFQGVGWANATVRQIGAEGYYVNFGDRGFTPDAWVIPVRVRAVNAPIPGAETPVRVGDRVEVLHRFLDGRVPLLRATVLEVNGDNLLIHCEGGPEFAHGDHFATNPAKRMETNIVRVIRP